MINLLPPETKESIMYARRNTMLRRWFIALVVAIVSITGTVGAGYMYLNASAKSYAAQVEQGKQDLAIQNLDQTQAKLQEITDSLKLVTQVLQREVLFSKLILQIGSALPNGSILTNLNINKIEGGLDLQAAARDYQTATQVQINLQDPNNKIFDKADIIKIDCSGAQGASVVLDKAFANQYPCTIELKALFGKDNSYLLIPRANGSATP